MMKTHKIGIFLALFLLVGFSSCKEQNTASKLLINEVLIDNESNFQDDYGIHSGWVEIFNRAYSSADLAGCYLRVSSQPGDTLSYFIPKGDVLTLLKPHNHIDPDLVSAALEFVREEGVDDVKRKPAADDVCSHAEDVCVAAADQARGAVGSTQSILGQFINFGTDSIYSIDYTYENDGKTTSGTVKFREPVKYYCASTFHFDAPVNEAAGRYTNGKLTITKANGKDDEYTTGRDNEYPYVNTVALSEAYKRTPVIEEFTSTTCGWCPFGLVGLPKAVEAVNGKAVAVAVHADYDANSYGYDPLVSSSYEKVAYQYASSFPSAFVNRESMTHAYTGIVEAVKEMAEKPCEASMTFTPKKTLQGIKMNTKLNFTIDAAEGEYGIAYAVTEDNVENVSQLNYFSLYYNEGTKKGNPQYVTWFNGLPSDVKPLATGKFTTIEDGNNISYWSDFTMNHVGCSIDDPTFATSEAVYNKLVLPAIVKGQEVAHTYTLKNPTRTAGKDNYGNALQYTSEVPAVNNENLKYAALLIDLRSGKILTGCQAALGETVTSNDKADLTAGINDVKADAADVADITAADGAFTVKANGAVAQVYDAQGRLVSSATVNGEASLPTFGKGVFIIRVTKGGNTTSQKAIF